MLEPTGYLLPEIPFPAGLSSSKVRVRNTAKDQDLCVLEGARYFQPEIPDPTGLSGSEAEAQEKRLRTGGTQCCRESEISSQKFLLRIGLSCSTGLSGP